MNCLDHQAIGQRLKALRHEKGYSQQEAATRFGLVQSSVSSLEAGHTKLSLELAVIIARALNVSVDALVVER